MESLQRQLKVIAKSGAHKAPHLSARAPAWVIPFSQILLPKPVSYCPNLAQELESVVADRNALQRQVMSITAAHEAETRQLHAEKAGLQVCQPPLHQRRRPVLASHRLLHSVGRPACAQHAPDCATICASQSFSGVEGSSLNSAESMQWLPWRMQVALQAAEEGAAGLRLRVSEAGRRLAEMVELRAHNAALQRRVEELSRDRQARLALEARIGKQQEEVSSFARSAKRSLHSPAYTRPRSHAMQCDASDQCQKWCKRGFAHHAAQSQRLRCPSWRWTPAIVAHMHGVQAPCGAQRAAEGCQSGAEG